MLVLTSEPGRVQREVTAGLPPKASAGPACFHQRGAVNPRKSGGRLAAPEGVSSIGPGGDPLPLREPECTTVTPLPPHPLQTTPTAT